MIPLIAVRSTDWASAGALAEAAASGWRVGRIATEDELEGAWADAVQRGAHRVFS